MALAQSTSRNIVTLSPLKPWKAAANQVFFAGGVVIIKTDGFAYVGVTGTGQLIPGVCAFDLDTTGLADGAKDVILTGGTIGVFENSANADLIAEDDIGKRCYLVDDETMALTNGGSTRSDAGMVFDVDADGRVTVQFELLRS